MSRRPDGEDIGNQLDDMQDTLEVMQDTLEDIRDNIGDMEGTPQDTGDMPENTGGASEDTEDTPKSKGKAPVYRPRFCREGYSPSRGEKMESWQPYDRKYGGRKRHQYQRPERAASRRNEESLEAVQAILGSRDEPRENTEETPEVPSCALTNRKPESFLKGEIVWAPHHEPNIDPALSIPNSHLRKTCAGTVFSKKRMFIVLAKHHEDLLGLPLYTYGEQGVMSRPEKLRAEHVCIRNVGDKEWVNQLPGSTPLVVRVYEGEELMSPMSCCRLTGGVKINAKTDLKVVGRLEKESWATLNNAWNNKIREGIWGAFEDPRPGNTAPAAVFTYGSSVHS